MIIREDAIANLPVKAVTNEVNGILRSGRDVVITAAPGAGKSTLLPLTILRDGIPEGGRILMLEPRRLAARQIAERMAFIAGEQVGATVGYSIRFERKVSDLTRIEVVTEGILTRRLIADPTLDGISAIIFDEFHERSLESDLALALTRDCCRILRPDLRIIIMSATIDSDAICSQLGAVHIDSPGKMFPVDISYVSKNPDPHECAAEVARAVSIESRKHDGDILAFLPGEAEIRRCASLLEGSLSDIKIYPLYGLLSNSEQRAAIAPSPPGSRKVVLATSIAETSITIEGVRVVIDSGLCRKNVFDARNGLSHLETVRISLDMARQRSGRAGRTAPGFCLRMWTEASEVRMEECRHPEILDADLCPCTLNVASWDGSGMESLPWMTPPPRTYVALARRSLTTLGAIDADGRITPLGRRLSALPCHPRIARMLLGAKTDDGKALAADLAAVLEDPTGYSRADRGPATPSCRSGLQGNTDYHATRAAGTDIAPIVNMLRMNGGKTNRIAKAAEQYRKIAGVGPCRDYVSSEDCGALLSEAYPERISKAVSGRLGHYLTAGGEPVHIEGDDEFSTSEWIVAANVSVREGAEGRIFLAAKLNRNDALPLARDVRNVGWDTREGRVVARSEKRIGKLVLSSRDISDITTGEMTAAICSAAQKDGLSMFNFNDDVQDLQRRIAMTAQWHPELELPDVSNEALLEKAAEWVPGILAPGVKTAAELKKLDICEAIWGLMDYGTRRKVEALAPSHIDLPPTRTPSGVRPGKHVRLQYRQGSPVPVLSVRIEDCFSLKDTPSVNSGKVPVLMELLSPGFKPVQLTSDLRGFWEHTYPEIRNELRRRYPKHPWPEKV